MRFAFTDDQTALAAALADLLDRECDPSQVRRAWAADDGRLPALWARLAEMGVLGVLAPPGVGGLGLTEVEMVLLLAEAGRHALPEPLADVSLVAVPAIRDHAQSDDAEADLEAIVEGRLTIGVGLDGDPSVLQGASAAMFLLEAPDGLHLVDRDVVEVNPVESVDGSRKLVSVTWTPSPATRLSGGPAAAQAARDRAALGAAAELCGLADTMLGLAAAYASERRQFGVAIGSFQAVKHRLADALLAVEFAKPALWRAAWSLAEGDPSAGVHVSMAKALASDAAELVGQAALQVHGAIGYTVECDLHLYLKRAWALSRRHGDARGHRGRVAESLGLGGR